MENADEAAWNIRDKHMMESLESLIQHLKQRSIAQPKIVICKPLL